MNSLPTKDSITTAHERIRKYIHKTPVMTSASIDEMAGCHIFFKCENFQKVGAFKFRGACNAVFSMSQDVAINGVGTHSSGNHAQALALAAKMRGIPAYIVMPDNSPKVKIDAVRGYGGEITFCSPTLAERESTMDKVQTQTNCNFIHPYTNPLVIAGQGTAAKEFIEETPELDYIIAPVGGGGLLAGTLIATSTLSPRTKVIAAEPEGANDAYKSLHSGTIVQSVNPDTIGDGLLTSLGEINFEIIQKFINDIITATDQQAIEALRLIWERMKIVIEPSSAFPLAVILANKDLFAGKKIGVILSGGNADIKNISNLL